MAKIKEKILERAKELFNKEGVAAISIRQISRDLGISHSNLIYHYKNKQLIISALHEKILEQAIEINKAIMSEPDVLKSLFVGTIAGYRVVFDYRFFYVDLNLIIREDEAMHQTILEIEKLRFQMYKDFINKMIAEEVMRPPLYEGEYAVFIDQIRVFSDYWVASAQVYDAYRATSVNKYVSLFLKLFYPYLKSEEVRERFLALLDEFNL